MADSPRYRCTACGNLTRFDVVESRRTKAYHHYSVGGELAVEDETVLEHVVESVTCRWCGTGADVETL
jgi:hypothetical protein